MRARLSRHVQLANPRIPAADAERQQKTAAAILERFDTQPGVILADEVGMGKTFVALAVAYSVIEAHDFDTQVVVMVPNSVRHKWPREWSVFRQACLPANSPVRAAKESVNDAIGFLKLLDDPRDTRAHILFATHHALTGQLRDSFVKLAILSRVLRRPSLEKQRHAFPNFAGRILRGSGFDDPEVTRALIAKSPMHWRAIWNELYEEPLEDDPVPQSVMEAMEHVRFDALAEALGALPLRESAFIDDRLRDVRRAISTELRSLWGAFLAGIQVELPLLVLDEAHHLKNPDTQLAQILTDGQDDEGNPVRGALAGMFRRMLFLSATPFQLGHDELISILHRFEGVRWADAAEKSAYQQRIRELDERLSNAQLAGYWLDQTWGRLQESDLEGAPDDWWSLADRSALPDRLQRAGEACDKARAAMKATEEKLRPWVIRHLRPDRQKRRLSLPGLSILEDRESSGAAGLRVEREAVFPFLLAARAQAIVAEEVRRDGGWNQALFAMGLASSFEAYRETRRRKLQEVVDDQDLRDSQVSPEVDWYLRQIDSALPDGHRDRWSVHPKIEASVRRAVALWDQGEKVVFFTFYRATGRALRRHISRALDRRILERGAERLGLGRGADPELVRGELRRISENRFRPEAPLRREIEELATASLRSSGLPESLLAPDPEGAHEGVLDLLIRFLRTPSFLVRFFDLHDDERLIERLRESYTSFEFGGRTLERQVLDLGAFLKGRTPEERSELLGALSSVQTGNIEDRPTDDDDETDRETLLPNVRLANGKTPPETRRNLMLAFNTPFFPEILIASSVMAEGVDLHLACRHVIHHDLDWNPSVLEQRTGRLDRIGSKGELLGRPIHVYEPFVEATQDEKMFRVVKDRERWFNVVMGEAAPVDEAASERASSRVPLPLELSSALSMRLSLD